MLDIGRDLTSGTHLNPTFRLHASKGRCVDGHTDLGAAARQRSGQLIFGSSIHQVRARAVVTQAQRQLGNELEELQLMLGRRYRIHSLPAFTP